MNIICLFHTIIYHDLWPIVMVIVDYYGIFTFSLCVCMCVCVLSKFGYKEKAYSVSCVGWKKVANHCSGVALANRTS